MAKSKHDDLADALARMASGEPAPSEELAPAPVPKPAAERPAAKPGLRPTTQQIPRGPAPKIMPRSPRPDGPPSASPPVTGAGAPPKRAAAPTLQAPTSAVQNFTSSAPATSLEDGDHAPDSDGQIIDDDDAMNIPAPDASVFARKSRQAPAPRPRSSAIYQTIEFRRTMIPVLLTTGLIMIVFAIAKFSMSEDSPLGALPAWLPVVLLGTGAVIFILAVFNMLSVKSAIAADGK